jgi:hypothetical protein
LSSSYLFLQHAFFMFISFSFASSENSPWIKKHTAP